MKNDDVAALEDLETGHWWGEERIVRLAQLVERNVPKRGRILEIGCGTGRILSELDQRSFDCFGVEPSKSGFESASKHLPNKIFNGTLRDYVDSEGSLNNFDCILLFDVLEHLEDDRNDLISIAKLVKPNGLIIFSVPADPKLWSKLDEEVFHFRRYTMRSIEELACSSYLTLQYSTYWCSILKAPIKIYRKMFNPSFTSNIKKPLPAINLLLGILIRFERLPWFGKIPGVSIFGIFHKSS